MNALKTRLNAHFAACAAVAATAAVAAPQNADAAIVYSGPVSINIPLTTAGVYLNVVTGVNNVSPAAVPGWDINPFSGTTLSWFAATPNASSGYIANLGSSVTLVDNLAPGTLISSANTFNFNNSSESTGATAFNFNSNNNYVGFRFQNEAAGNQVQYGWVQVHLGATFTDPTRAIIGYAYENTGTGINSGAVPAPGALALLGLAGIVGGRRRRVA